MVFDLIRKSKIEYILFIAFILFSIPFILFKTPNKNNAISKVDDNVYVKVLIKERNVVVRLNIEDYLIGVVAAEMPASFPFEALKAQAVAARTYAVKKIIDKADHNGQKIFLCNDYTCCQDYIDIEEMKKRWKNDFYKYYNIIKDAVYSTKGIVMVYNKEVINSYFHAASGGKTEEAKEVFGHDYPYLKSVESYGEEACPKFYGSVKMKVEDFLRKIKTQVSDLKISRISNQTIKIIERTKAGSVRKLKIGNKIVSGILIRNIFNLNSTEFWIEMDRNYITIKTKGYGHGVGMSQWGARYLALEGMNYMEILKYYYNGITFAKIKQKGAK